MRKLNILAVSLSAAFILAGCDGEESTTENIAVEVPFTSNSIPMPNDGYGYDEDGSISLPDEPSSIQSYSTNEEYEAYYQSFETSFAAVDGWGLCVEPIEIPLDSVNSGQVPAIDSSSLEGNVLLLDSSGNEIDGTKLTSDGRQLTIQCGAALQPGTPYYLAVTNGVKTTQGTPLQPSSGFTQLLNTDPSELDEHEQWLQTTTQEAVDIYNTTGNQHSLVYASKFTTQNSYSVIDNVIQQTLVDNPEILWDEVTHKKKGISSDDQERHVIVSAHLKSNNYLPLTQDNATEEKCKLDIYDPVASCPSMYKWMTGTHGEHLTSEYFTNTVATEKITLQNDESTLIPVDFYLPYIKGKTDTLATAIQYIRDTSNKAVIFIHGITGSKDDASLVAKKYVTGGKNFVFAAIDMPYHGARIVCDSSNYSDETTLKYCDSGKPISARADKSYFINITSPLALRSNIHQSISDFIGLRASLNFGDSQADRETHLIGVSLGGIMSVMTTEATYGPNHTDPIRGLKFDTSNFVVPGQGLVNVVLSSLTLSSEMEESVKKSADVQRAIAETLIPNLCTVETSNEECITQLNAHSEQLNDSIEMLEDEIYNALIPILKQGVQQTIDGSDPAGKVTRQREAKQSTLLIEAKGTCRGTCEIGDYMPDTVVPNSADNNTMTGTEPLIRALGLEPILESENDPNGLRGVIRATVGGHGTFLFPYEGPMDETGLPSTSDLDDVEASRQTQQDAVLEMIQTKGEDITLDATDKENIIDINDFDDVAHSEEVN
ncbi:Ig-like domain-containing protein [Vibrio coralliilyticus]|uniref:Ig-like domain-containing protein n=1 Tax=Vibrio coralliilyticus TaxID=190893 RepID=UPI00240A8732|nr:Ig-like domain-containing protein [Vibrio coralliilyticus]WFB47184.1 Ig-like domain-containing protein [Vibrio coralliilyticus]